MKIRSLSALFGVFSLILGLATQASDSLNPYVMAADGKGDMAKDVIAVTEKLTTAGFTVVGDYAPYSNAHVIAVTNDEIKANAGNSEFGVYGAVVKVSLTAVAGKMQVAYTNPIYLANAYRMKDSLEGVAAKLKETLSGGQGFGSEDGVEVDDLREYQYKSFVTPDLDSAQDDVAKHSSYEEAVEHINKALAKGVGGSQKVYQVDLGNDKTLFGVAFSEGDSADKSVMDIVDSGEMKHTAHLPYEVAVMGRKVYFLNAKFRLAVMFPDLSMGTFMKISSVPGAIEDVIEEIAD
jgi:hypothetical protein